MRKIYSFFLVVFCSFIFSSSLFSQGNTCAQATPFCTSVGVPFTYPNVHNGSLAPTGNSYGCLCQSDSYNPSWFYLKTTAAGTMDFSLSQATGGGSGIDVDFVAWGPFSTYGAMCSGLSGSCSTNCAATSAVTCSGNIEDCGSSPSSTESMSLVSPGAGYYFMILITNFDGSAGNITLTQTGGPGTDCSITCPSVLSGPGIVNAPSTNPTNGVAATPVPSTVSCTSGLIDLYASNLTPFGNPITPGALFTVYANAKNGNTIKWYENGSQVGTATVTPNTSYQLEASYMSPSATNSFSFCETATSGANMPTNVSDLATNSSITTFTWAANGVCSGYTIPAGAIKGIATWTSTCGSCLTNVTDWGYAQFDPSAASIGTHTITYSFNPQSSCATYTTSVTITVTNPFNASFVPPGPLCANASCSNLTPSNTYTVGTGSWSGTGVSGSQFCPSTSGAGTFAVTYSVGTSSTCKATYSNNVVVNALPTVTASAANSGTVCSGSSITLTSGGANTYSWTPGGATTNTISVTPTVSPSTYTVRGTNTTTGCSNTAQVTVTVSPTPTISVTNTLSANSSTLCNGASAVLSASGASSYTWSPGTGLSSTTGGTVSANPSVTTIYTVTGTSLSGCTSSSSSQGTFTVVVNPTPTISVTNTLSTNSSTLCSGTSATLTASGASSYTWSPASGLSSTTGGIVTATPGTTTVYTVTGTSSSGCSSSSSSEGTFTVVVNPTPTISVTNTLSTNTSTLCNGGSATLTANGANSYTWSPGAGLNTTSGGTVTATPSITTIYTVTGSSALGCTSPSGTQGTFTVYVNPTPTIVVTNTLGANSSTLCSGTSATLTASGASSYTWSPITDLSSSTGSLVVANPTTTTIYTVSGTSSAGCSGPSSVQGTFTVVVNPTPTISVTNSLSANSSTLCSGTSETLTATGADTYTWSPSTDLNSSTGGTVIATPGTTTIYTVTGTSLAGCTSPSSSEGTFTVVVNPTPTISVTNSLSANSSTLCSGTSETLTATGADTYTWSPSTDLNTSTGGTVIATPGTTTIYTVTGTSLAGCTSPSSSEGTFTVIVNPTPTITINNGLGSNTSTLCSGVSETLTANGANSYTWTPSTSLNTSNGSIVIATPSVTTTYTVTGTSSAGCSGPSSVQGTYTVVVNPTPTITISNGLSSNTSTLCSGTSETLTASGADSYTWNPATDLNTSTGGTVIATPNSTTVYTVTGTSLAGCSSAGVSDGTFTVVVNPTPTITLVSGGTNSQSVCAGESVSGLTFSVNPAGTVDWVNNNTAIGLGASGTGASIPSFTSSNVSNTEIGVITVTATSSSGNCPSTSNSQYTYTITVNPLPLVSVTNTMIPCASNSVTIIASTTNSNAAYSWSGPNSGSILSGGNTSTPSVAEAGTYSVIVTDGVTTCSNSAVLVVSQSSVSAAFIADPSAGISPLDVNFTNQSIGATGYSWTFGDTNNNTSTATDPNHIYQAGTYTVVLIATAGPCSDTASAVIIVEEGLSLQVPNVFTPNNDGVNDVFTIQATGVKNIDLQIFNRWGLKVYSFSGPKAGWDGIEENGKAATAGTYFYFVKVTGFDDKEIEKQGTVNLYR